MSKILGCVLVLYLVVPAQDNDNGLTLPRALELGKTNNLDVQQQEQKIKRALAALSSEKSDHLPSLSVNGSYSHVSDIATLELPFTLPGRGPLEIEAGVRDQYDLHVAVQQAVFTGFRIHNQVQMARQEAERVKIERQVTQHRILLQIHRIYYSAQLNMLQQKVIRSGLQRAEKHLQTAINLHKAGQATAFDTMKVSNQVLEMQTRLRKMDHAEHIILTQLALILNQPEVEGVMPFAAESISLSLQSQDFYLEQAIRNRPELSVIRHGRRVQEYRKKIARSRYFPQIYAGASYHYAKPGVNFFRNEWMDYYQFGINLQWKLWNWGKTGRQVEQADYAINLLSLEEQKLLNSIRQEVKQAYRKLLSDREQIEMIRQLVEQEKERYRITRQKFLQGVASTLDLTDAENALTSADLQLQQSYIDWLKDRAQLAYAAGQIGHYRPGNK